MNKKLELNFAEINLTYEATVYQGHASTVYKCHVQGNKNILVCVKTRSINKDSQSINQEAKLLEQLTGITPMLHYIQRKSNYDLIAMEYMGNNLYDRFQALNNRFSVKTIVLIGLNILHILQTLHAEGYVHGRLSPRRILSERDSDKTSLCFAGLVGASKYIDENKEHIKFKQNETTMYVGDEFSSVNGHVGSILSRRDDIESLAYTLLYFDTRGEIYDIRSRSTDGKDIYKWKASTPAELMHPKASIEFVQLLNYARSLKFEEQPNYERITKMLKNLFDKHINAHQSKQLVYDWCIKTTKTSANTPPRVSEKRKALHDLLECEKSDRFPTIMETSSEYTESQIFDEKPDQNGDSIGDLETKFGTLVSADYNDLQDTPKLQSDRQPSLRHRVIRVGVTDHGIKSFSPWNCSESTDDMASILDKVKSLEFKTAMGVNY